MWLFCSPSLGGQGICLPDVEWHSRYCCKCCRLLTWNVFMSTSLIIGYNEWMDVKIYIPRDCWILLHFLCRLNRNKATLSRRLWSLEAGTRRLCLGRSGHLKPGQTTGHRDKPTLWPRRFCPREAGTMRLCLGPLVRWNRDKATLPRHLW
jgi:hypothetical protein